MGLFNILREFDFTRNTPFSLTLQGNDDKLIR